MAAAEAPVSEGHDAGAPEEVAEISILLCKEDDARRKAIELLLHASGFRLAGHAQEISAAVAMASRRNPAVILADIDIGSNIDRLKSAVEAAAPIPIVLYTDCDEPDLVKRAFACGARGYVTKDASVTGLELALRSVARGEAYVDPRLSEVLLDHSNSPPTRLSPRQLELLALLAAGLNGEQIARELFLSPQTVRAHVRNVMAALDARTRAHAVALGLNQGLISMAESPDGRPDG